MLVSHKEGKFSNPAFLKDIGKPFQVDIDTCPGHRTTKNFPRHIVGPAILPVPVADKEVHAKLIDFEQSFLHTEESLAQVRTPTNFRALEAPLDSKRDLRIDTWSLACTIFELVTGQPPFADFMPAKAPLVLEWRAMFGDLPKEWTKQAEVVVDDCRDEIDEGSLTN